MQIKLTTITCNIFLCVLGSFEDSYPEYRNGKIEFSMYLPPLHEIDKIISKFKS